jgi:uncharacterized membrane protein YhfC
MAISALLSIGTPILLFFWLRKHYKMSAISVWVGVAAFVIFVLILEGTIHGLVLKFALIDVKNQPVLFMLYAALMAGLFEETARFISFRLLRKNTRV